MDSAHLERRIRTCPTWCSLTDPHYHVADDGAHIIEGYEGFEPTGDGPISAEEALERINRIRNSIVGAQAINWSEHIYPLVAILNRAGLEGLPYPEAKANIGTLIDFREEAIEAARALRRACQDAGSPVVPATVAEAIARVCALGDDRG